MKLYVVNTTGQIVGSVYGLGTTTITSILPDTLTENDITEVEILAGDDLEQFARDFGSELTTVNSVTYEVDTTNENLSFVKIGGGGTTYTSGTVVNPVYAAPPP